MTTPRNSRKEFVRRKPELCKDETLTPDEEKRIELVQAYLDQGSDLKQEMKALAFQMKILAEKAMSLPSASDYSNAGVRSSSPEEAVFTGLTDKKIDVEKVIRKRQLLLERLDEQIMYVIVNAPLTSLERSVLSWRYSVGKSWKEVAAIMHYSERHLRRILKDAMKKIELPDDAIWI